MKSGASITANEEFHYFIDRLAADKVSGEVTLYFNNGVIEHSRISKKITGDNIQIELQKAKEAKMRTVGVSIKCPKT